MFPQLDPNLADFWQNIIIFMQKYSAFQNYYSLGKFIFKQLVPKN